MHISPPPPLRRTCYLFTLLLSCFALFLTVHSSNGGGGISEAKDPTIRTSPTDIIQLCSADEYATITYQGVECKRTTDSWVNECTTRTDCCNSGELLKITPEGLKCFPKTNTSSTYTTYCADCCTTGEFAVITTLGLRCAGAGCTTDTECTTPLPYCDPTINRCVQCTKDSHCPGDENYCVNNKCQQCTWDTEYSCNQQITKRVKHCKLTDGTIKKTKILSCSSREICKNNQCIVPPGCSTTTATWTGDTHSCTGSLTTTNHNQKKTIRDTSIPGVGTATYKCWAGSWQKQSSSCVHSCTYRAAHWGSVPSCSSPSDVSCGSSIPDEVAPCQYGQNTNCTPVYCTGTAPTRACSGTGTYCAYGTGTCDGSSCDAVRWQLNGACCYPTCTEDNLGSYVPCTGNYSLYCHPTRNDKDCKGIPKPDTSCSDSILCTCGGYYCGVDYDWSTYPPRSYIVACKLELINGICSYDSSSCEDCSGAGQGHCSGGWGCGYR